MLSNARTTPAGITPFHCHDGLDEVFVGSLRARLTAVSGRKQHAVLSFAQHTVEMQQSGRLHNDGGTKDTRRAHEQGAQAGDDPIRGTQVGRTLAPAIEDEELMLEQHGLGDNGTESTRPRESGQGDDQMNKYDSEVTHPGNGINTSKTTALRPILQLAIDRGLDRGEVVTVRPRKQATYGENCGRSVSPARTHGRRRIGCLRVAPLSYR